VTVVAACLFRLVDLFLRGGRRGHTMESRAFELERIINSLLKTSLRDCGMNEQLTEILNILARVSWLSISPRGAVFLTNGDNELIMIAHHNLSRDQKEACARISVGECLCGRAAAKREILFSNCIDARHTIRPGGMRRHGHYNVPLVKDGKLLGVMVLYVPHNHSQGENEELFIEMIGNTVANIIAKKILEEQIKISHYEVEESRNETISKLLSASEFRDPETGMHIKRMTEYAVAIGKEIGLPARNLSLLRQCAPMHDIGKIAIQDSILLKPGPLTKKEYQVMQTHTTVGADLLKGRTEYLRVAREIALTHHESWDGRGYPYGLKGERIPLWGRICAVSDVFDALTSDRPYKKKWSMSRAMEYIVAHAGTQFDPRLVDAFIRGIGTIKRIMSIYRDDITDGDSALTMECSEKQAQWLQWDDSLSIGINTIDAQHQFLICVANEVHKKVRSGEGADVVIPAINKMMDYSDIHFTNEEKIMQAHAFPDLEEHKKAHDFFIKKLEYFQDSLKEYPLVVGNEIAFFLRDWLVSHIQGEDIRIRDYVE